MEGMYESIRPKPGDIVHYWTPADKPEDDPVCNVAIVAGIGKEGVLEWRPYLNLTVFRASDAKPWARMDIPAVMEDGGVTFFNHRYSLVGEFSKE